ncbi:two-component system response regulator [Azoarcus sp. KH32C]|uniref:response regulator n=1 Tax=Azoarcus sp. KH32C TaxID=748247 RepID=UPI0002387090|nr:response regulator [Azoarcus sp. KH32C]BAL26692.1 putative response regulator receiver modulated metal dependent phosphohydrolase [Azoarcus sp. KH32C]
MPTSSPASVLIVDDDPRNRKLIETLLRVDGFEVKSADSGAAALAAVAAELPDLILLDLMMPDMDGFEVVRRLKADPAANRVPIVMVTALDDSASRARLAAAGVERVLVKPVDRWQLKALMAELLGLE